MKRSTLAAIAVTFSFCLSAHWVLAQAAPPDGNFAPNPFIRIAPNNVVAVIAKRGECAGADTMLTTIVAQELGAHWSQIRIEPRTASMHRDLLTGKPEASDGIGCGNSWDQHRRGAAMARMMLVAGAAAKWDVPASEISVRCGVVRHEASGLETTFGPLAPVAAVMPVPTEVEFADRREVCGRPRVQG